VLAVIRGAGALWAGDLQALGGDDMGEQAAAGAVDHIVDFTEAPVVVRVGNIAETEIGRIIEEQAEAYRRTADHAAQCVEMGALGRNDVVETREIVRLDHARAVGVADAAFGKQHSDPRMRRVADVPRTDPGRIGRETFIDRLRIVGLFKKINLLVKFGSLCASGRRTFYERIASTQRDSGSSQATRTPISSLCTSDDFALSSHAE
jgi:hypothetical protein